MVAFSFEEYADIIYVYGVVDGNSVAAVREYQRRFPNRRIPDSKVFSRTFARLKETGCVASNFRESRSGSSAERADVEQDVVDFFSQNPEASTRRVAQQLGLRSVDVWRIVKREGLRPYHHVPVQALLEGDYSRRVQFCRWLLDCDLRNRSFLNRILWTDESQFTRDGVTNFHNLHTWSDINPHKTRSTSFQHKFSVNVWAGIIGNRLIGPFLLPQVLNSQIYLNFLENTLPALLEDIPLLTRRSLFYQHDGAPAHTSTIVKEKLQQMFPERWIGRNGPIPWPARSPDLTPLDFFLWGAMKNDVYSVPVHTREDLVRRIETAANNIKERLATINLKKSMKKRALTCIISNGENFEQFL